ncbi:putative histone acetyltransferase saga associated factor sgf29, partial [Fasciola gigantica]
PFIHAHIGSSLFTHPCSIFPVILHRRYTLARSKVIPLPKWKANPVTHPDAIFTKGTAVFALYPQTTCFYKAIVDEVPVHIHDEYSLYFEDSSYPEGYAPAIRIPQRYVVECRESPAANSRRRSLK